MSLGFHFISVEILICEVTNFIVLNFFHWEVHLGKSTSFFCIHRISNETLIYVILNVTRKFLISFKSEEGLFVKIGLFFFRPYRSIARNP